MTCPAPEYMKYFDNDKGCIKDDAPDEIKEEYERCYNAPGREDILRIVHPELKHPYKCWNGEVIERPKK